VRTSTTRVIQGLSTLGIVMSLMVGVSSAAQANDVSQTPTPTVSIPTTPPPSSCSPCAPCETPDEPACPTCQTCPPSTNEPTNEPTEEPTTEPTEESTDTPTSPPSTEHPTKPNTTTNVTNYYLTVTEAPANVSKSTVRSDNPSFTG
jgi:hypothetical protein